MTRPDKHQIRARAEAVFRTVTPLERADAWSQYQDQRRAERERMLLLRKQRLERDEGGVTFASEIHYCS
jgi:hypothetical protein